MIRRVSSQIVPVLVGLQSHSRTTTVRINKFNAGRFERTSDIPQRPLIGLAGIGPWVRERDPIFERSNVVEMKPKRITAKQARETLAEAIRDVEQCLRDAGWSCEAIERDAKLNRYRQIAA